MVRNLDIFKIVRAVRKLHEKIAFGKLQSELADEHDVYNEGYEDALSKILIEIEVDFEEFIKF